VKTSLNAGDKKESNENDKHIPLHLKYLSKIHICAFAVLDFWQNFEKIQKLVPRIPSFVCLQWPTHVIHVFVSHKQYPGIAAA